jgi:hypothetical protein
MVSDIANILDTAAYCNQISMIFQEVFSGDDDFGKETEPALKTY